jgi:hypothetical protein
MPPPGQNSRYRAVRVLGALAVGAAINVGVAWACALFSPIHGQSYMPEGGAPIPWPLGNEFAWPEPDY